jgi:sugar O-acyltransferase (sialic acid O-acetyltransferase NeuD family)
MDSLFLVGGGGHCHACIDVVEAGNKYKIEGIVEQPNSGITSVLGYPVIGINKDLPDLVAKYKFALISIGQIKNPNIRTRLFNLLRDLGAELPSIISPHAYVSSYGNIGSGSTVMHGAIINTNASIGVNCIINTKALIEHDVVISDHCHVATGATINGGSTIGKGTFIGSGAVVIQGVNIGENCIIGAGALVTKDLISGTFLRGR